MPKIQISSGTPQTVVVSKPTVAIATPEIVKKEEPEPMDTN